MEQQSSSSSKMETFRFFDGSPQPGFGLNFLESSEKPFSPLPSCIEVLPSPVSSNVKYTVESVDIDGITMIKGRVNTREVFANLRVGGYRDDRFIIDSKKHLF